MKKLSSFLLFPKGKRLHMKAFPHWEGVRWALLFFFLLPSIWIGPGMGCLLAQFTFVHITDMHISNTTSFVNGCDLDGEMAQCYFQGFANLNPKPAFVIATGDISNIGNNSSYGMYPTLTQYLFPGQVMNPGSGAYFIDSALTIPIYFTPGNHDYYTTLIPPLSSDIDYYSQYLAPDTDYVVTTDSAVMVFMRSGSDRPFWLDPNPLTPEGTGLSDSQIIWLRNELSAAGNKRKIIAMHHPPVNYEGSVSDTAENSIVNNRTTFLNICDSNQVDIVIAGHVHQNVVVSRAGNVVSENWSDGTRYVQTGAAIDNSYRTITVSSSFVTVSPPLISCSQIGLAPVANFTANPTSIVADSSVNFTDISTNSPTSWSWTFQGGSPSSSTGQNPSNIAYSTAGCYDVKLVATNTFGSDSLTETCYIDVNPVGMDELQVAGSRLQVYPNPSNGRFQVSSIRFHVDRIEIYNMYGQKVYETSNFDQQTSNEIDLSESPKGIYCVNFYDGEKIHTKKIVIQ